eukprot:symbB.v1.2.037071.t2/scaffold5370.1/size27944/4
MSYLADHSGRYTHVMQPATAPLSDESALLNGHLPPPVTLLTSKGPANLQNADKESFADESDKSSEAEDKPGPEYSTLKPFLWIFCDGIKPKLSFLGKTPCF